MGLHCSAHAGLATVKSHQALAARAAHNACDLYCIKHSRRCIPQARNILVAKHHYLRVLQQLPSMHAGSLLRLASCMAEQGQFEAAGDIYQRVCERTPSATAWLGVGVAALRTGGWQWGMYACCVLSAEFHQVRASHPWHCAMHSGCFWPDTIPFLAENERRLPA